MYEGIIKALKTAGEDKTTSVTVLTGERTHLPCTYQFIFFVLA